MSFTDILDWKGVHERLQQLFPAGTPNREACVRKIAAKTIFVMLYAGAVEGTGRWIRPDQVTRMTNRQARQLSEAARSEWCGASLKSAASVPGRWYAVNTRESIRDDTIRYGLVQNGVVIERGGLPTTSPAARYALNRDFADLLAPELDKTAFVAKADAWRQKALNAGALARIAILRKGAVRGGKAGTMITFPNGETRRMSSGESTDIAKAVVEIFSSKFLKQPGVVFLSESGNKVVARDDELAQAIGLVIPADKSLPDIVLVDLGPEHPLLVFVEVVSTDGPVNEARKQSLLQLAQSAGFTAKNVAFVTAFLDRSSAPFRKTAHNLAWGTYAWFASEPDKLLVFSENSRRIEGT